MTLLNFQTYFGDLPSEIPIFPLSDVILLPYGCLPLTIQKKEHFNLINHALGQSRLLGIIQTKTYENELYNTGCVGRITSFEEQDDGSIAINLTGICRFNTVERITETAPDYNTAVNWSLYEQDCTETETKHLNYDKIIPILKAYLDKKNMICDKWAEIRTVREEKLIANLSMICPLGKEEKQSLLETKKLIDRISLLEKLLQMALINDSNNIERH